METTPYRRWAPWIAALLAFAPFLALHGYVGREHDDALYVLASQSLAEGSYRHWHLPGSPPITLLTPGLPALLLPAAWAQAPLTLYQILATAHLSAAVVLLFLWLRRRETPETATAFTALFALNPLVLSRAGAVMPEPAALALALGGLLAWDKGRFLAAGCLSAAACLVRPAALPLALAFWAAALLNKDRRAFWNTFLPPVAAMLLWRLWCAGAGLAEASELRDNYAAAPLLTMGRTALANTAGAARAWGSTFLPPSAPEKLSMLLGTGLTLPAVYGLWKERSRREPGDLFLALSGAMHLAWPWWYDRYLLTLLPFLQRRALPRGKTWALAALAAAQFALHGHRWLARDAGLEAPPHAAAYEWIRENTTPQGLWAAPFHARDALYTGRVFVPIPLEGGPAAALAALDRMGAEGVLWPGTDDLGFSSAAAPAMRALRGFETLLNDPSLFRPMMESGGVRIYARTAALAKDAANSLAVPSSGASTMTRKSGSVPE